MNPFIRFIDDDLRGVHFAVNVFVASAILWLLLQSLLGVNPIWAVSAMVAVSDPRFDQATSTFRGSIANTLLGSAIGLLFLAIGGSSAWELPTALALTVLVSSYVVRVPTMWRQAPVAAAIVIAAGLSQSSSLQGEIIGLHRAAEVVCGCLVGLSVAWAMSKLWPLRAPPA